MLYSLYRQLINLTEEFEKENQMPGKKQLAAFAGWLYNKVTSGEGSEIYSTNWEGKENGRSAESVINTSLVHLYRYAKIYGKNAVNNSRFSTIDEVIFLINLKHSGSMTKTELIAKNIHEKSTGIQIINRLLKSGHIAEDINQKDKRSKKITITSKGIKALDEVMVRIREASRIVTGDLTEKEKSELIVLLQKLEHFHSLGIKELQI